MVLVVIHTKVILNVSLTVMYACIKDLPAVLSIIFRDPYACIKYEMRMRSACTFSVILWFNFFALNRYMYMHMYVYEYLHELL